MEAKIYYLLKGTKFIKNMLFVLNEDSAKSSEFGNSLLSLLIKTCTLDHE